MNTWRKRGRTKKQVNKRRAQESLPRTPLAETQQTISNCVIVWCQWPVSGFFFFLLQSKNTIKTVSSNNNRPHRAGMKQRHWGEMKRNKAGFFFLKHSHDPFQSTTFHNETPTPTLHSKCLPCCSYLQTKGWSFSEKVGWEVGGAAVSGGGPSPATFSTVQLFLTCRPSTEKTSEMSERRIWWRAPRLLPPALHPSNCLAACSFFFFVPLPKWQS